MGKTTKTIIRQIHNATIEEIFSLETRPYPMQGARECEFKRGIDLQVW